MARSFLDRAYEALLPLVATVTKNPRAMKPGELVRLLNSTPVGEVLTERRLRAHRERAGHRIGEGKTLDLLRYAAWLCQQPRSITNEAKDLGQSPGKSLTYRVKKERERARNAEASREGRDIGAIPAVADPKRREKCRRNFRLFCETYLPEQFPLAWSKDHLKAIAKIEASVLEGGLFAFAMPRGSGKTTLCEAAAIWSILFGHRRFVPLIGASAAAAREMLASIRTEIETNELLAADFPEVCFPIGLLEGINNRANAQLCQGELTRITWGKDTLIMPTIKGSVAAGGVLKCVGITGRVRGMKHKLADGTTLRPDLVIVDDPQTDRTARSEDQCRKRVQTLGGTVVGLAGPGKKIAGFMPCTVIERGDMADQILDREKFPAWQGMRFKLLYSFPTAEKLWDEYAELRRTSLRNGGNGADGTAYYKKHRKAMDAGGEIAWPARFNKDELSAIQNAMNLLIDDEAAFWAESQNEPIKDKTDDDDVLSANQIAKKINQLPRGVVPDAAIKITGYIDVQHSLLYWLIVAWTDRFGGFVLDYGAYPEQGRTYFKLREVRKTLAKAYPGQSATSAVFSGLNDLVEQLAGRAFKTEGGLEMKLDRLLIDSADGNVKNEVMRVCRTHPARGILLPALGRAVRKNERPMHQWPVKEGEKIGNHWILQRAPKFAVRQLVIEPNYWKSFIHRGLFAALGEPHAISFYGAKGTNHTMLADHCSAEARKREKIEQTGGIFESWAMKPGQSENHLFDCLCSAAAAASSLGITILPSSKPKNPARASQTDNVSYLSI